MFCFRIVLKWRRQFQRRSRISHQSEVPLAWRVVRRIRLGDKRMGRRRSVRLDAKDVFRRKTGRKVAHFRRASRHTLDRIHELSDGRQQGFNNYNLFIIF